MVDRRVVRTVFLVGSIFLGLSNRSVTAEEVGKLGADLTEKSVETAKAVGSTLTRAVRYGDTDAMIELASDYLLPACLALLCLIVAYMFASWAGRIVGLTVARKVDLTLGKFLSKMIKNVLMLMVAVGILSQFGFDVTSFAAVLAAGGFAVGMALQGTLANFAAGVMLLVFRPFRVGDYIKVADTEGTVDEIDLFTTRLNSLDNRHLILPNGSVFGSTIENVTHNPQRRVDVNVGVCYQADIAMTRRVLEQASGQVAGAVPHPAPQVYLTGLGDSSVNWQVRVWCRPDAYWDVRERTVAAAKQCLDAAGISIPYPQMDVHVVGNGVAGITHRAAAA